MQGKILTFTCMQENDLDKSIKLAGTFEFVAALSYTIKAVSPHTLHQPS